MAHKTYSSYAEFEREEIRPSFRIGFSVDEIEEVALDAYEDYVGDDFFNDFTDSRR